MVTHLVVGIIVLEGFGKTFRHGFRQIHLPDAVSCTLQQSDVFLAESQNIEARIVSKERKQGLQVEMVTDDDLFLQADG